MTVLIVDDDIPTTQVLEEQIDWSLLGVRKIYKAFNAQHAIQLLDAHRPELVLTDIEMPKGSGIDVLRYAREKKHTSQFIILTCHEDFTYASQALHYEALDYLVKPFNLDTMQAAVAKALEKIAYQKQQEEEKHYKEEWLSSATRREKNFWRDLLFARIPPDEDYIRTVLISRRVELSLEESYTLVLATAKESDVVQRNWTAQQFAYAISNMLSEIVGGVPEHPSVQYYVRNGRCGAVLVLGSSTLPNELEQNSWHLVENARTYLGSEVNICYRDNIKLKDLCAQLKELQEIDYKNVEMQGGVRGNEKLYDTPLTGPEPLNLEKIGQLLLEEQGAKAINQLRAELDRLSAAGHLNYETLHRVHEDYIQLVYTILYNNNIQAHKLFSDKATQKLFYNAESSVFDMMRWASVITEKMLSYQKEMRKTETVIDSIKNYINQNYNHELSRNEIAASVYLSPDYVAKIFKADTGMFLKDYINEIRIQKAKKLLLDDAHTVSEVASLVGMDNFSYFSTLFKKNTGLSPREYKQKTKQSI